MALLFCFFSSRRRHTRFDCDWSSDVCSSDLTTWVSGADPLGSIAWFNGLSSAGRASFAAEAGEMPEGADVNEAARRFVEERLRPRDLGDEVLSVQAEPAEPWRVADRDGLRVRVTIRETGGVRRLMVFFVPR